MTRDWSTHPARVPTRRLVGWKVYLGEACPHGRLVVLVHGTHVRDEHDSDFCQGGNGFAYPDFVPRDEIWVDDCVPQAERALVAMHECIEAELMLGGASYDAAHREAKRLEDAWRRVTKCQRR